MKRKGINFRHAPHLSHRSARPGDLDSRGRQVEFPYVIIVRVADCLDDKEEFSLDLRKEAPAHATLAYSRTNMGYGEYRKMNRPKGFWVQVRPHLTPAEYKAAEEDLKKNGTPIPKSQEWQVFDHYWSCPVYWVETGAVYTASSSTYVDPAEHASRKKAV